MTDRPLRRGDRVTAAAPPEDFAWPSDCVSREYAEPSDDVGTVITEPDEIGQVLVVWDGMADDPAEYDPDGIPSVWAWRLPVAALRRVEEAAEPLTPGHGAELAARLAQVERERDEARALVASPIMGAVRARPGLGHVQGTDEDLLRRALGSTHGWEPATPRWGHVGLITGHGLGVSVALCDVIGVDPYAWAPDDEETCARCGAPLDHGGGPDAG